MKRCAVVGSEGELEEHFAFSTRTGHLFFVKGYETLMAPTVLGINYELLSVQL